jgi:hypothetical protein
MVALVDDKTTMAALACFMGKGGAEQARTYYEVIVLRHSCKKEWKK